MQQEVLYLKLVSGENIISIAEVNDEYIILDRPLQIFIQNTVRGSALRLARWIPFSTEKDFVINTKDVIISILPSKDMKDYYIEAIDHLDDITSESQKEDEEVVRAMYEKYSNNTIRVH